MADTKITDLTALTGANVATGDDFVLVDVSDSTMNASGTDKKITANELRIAIATTLGAVGIDKIFDAKGDLAVGTGADTSSALTVSATQGHVPQADASAATGLSYAYPMDLERAAGSPGIAQNMSRYTVLGNQNPLTSAQLLLASIWLPKNKLITSITFRSATTALNVGSNQWFGLFDTTYAPLRLTGDDTNVAWGANTEKTLNLSSTFTTTYAGLHYGGIMVKATTVPTLLCCGVGIQGATPTPILFGTSTGSLTNPASCPNPVAAPTPINNCPWFYVS